MGARDYVQFAAMLIPTFVLIAAVAISILAF